MLAQSTIKKRIPTRITSTTINLAMKILPIKLSGCLKEPYVTISSTSPISEIRYRTFPQPLKRRPTCFPNSGKEKTNFNQNYYLNFPSKIFDQKILTKLIATSLYTTVK
nr:hypothetical protein [Candidatus Baldrarchaeota archaeon]